MYNFLEFCLIYSFFFTFAYLFEFFSFFFEWFSFERESEGEREREHKFEVGDIRGKENMVWTGKNKENNKDILYEIF